MYYLSMFVFCYVRKVFIYYKFEVEKILWPMEILTLVFNLHVIEKAVLFVWLPSLTHLILNKEIISNVN